MTEQFIDSPFALCESGAGVKGGYDNIACAWTSQ
uniref:Uncharacterized protein n=1 Tax=Geobacter sp. (strain M21) TaxID=443144 RepID=C6E2F1_GEOSM